MNDHESREPDASRQGTLSLTFERLTVESLALPWHRLEEIHEGIHEKRRLVEQHTSVAMEHLRAIAVLNAEIFALEKEFSSVMSTVVAERSRSQDKLKALIRQWESTQAMEETARANAASQQHQNALQAAKQEAKKLRKALEEKQRTIDVVQQERDDMHHLLKEYNLDAAGPLLESIQSRRIELQRSELRSAAPEGSSMRGAPKDSSFRREGGSDAGVNEGKPATRITSLSSFTRDPAANRAKIERRLSADTSLAASAPPAEPHRRESILQDSTAEIVRLQGELAAAKRESMLRKQEADALRSTREDSMILNGSGMFNSNASGRGFASSAASVAASDIGPTGFGSGRSAASSQHLASYNALQSSRALLYDTHGSVNDHPVSLGLELGTRRQQQGLAGVHVVSVAEGSPAEAGGLAANDIIVAWAGRVVNRLDDVHSIIRLLSTGPPISTLDVRFLRPGPDANCSGEDYVPGSEEIHTALIELDGRMEGPVDSRRASFRSR